MHDILLRNALIADPEADVSKDGGRCRRRRLHR